MFMSGGLIINKSA